MADKVIDFHNFDDTKYAGLISEIQLPGSGLPYQLHDPDALHDISELGLDSAIVFGGVVENEEELRNDIAKPGVVFYIKENDREVIWVQDKDDPADQGHWEDFGSGVSLDHTHNVTASGTAQLSGNNTLTGSATITGHNAASRVTGTAIVTGHNDASNVSAEGSIKVPTVSSTKNYVKLTKDTDTFVKSYAGATNKLVTTSVTPAGTATSVVSGITPNTEQIAGVSGSTTASKATAAAAKDIAKAGTAVNVPNISVTSATVVNEVTPTNKSFSNMSATVSGTCLVFSTASVGYVESVAHTDTTVGSASKGTDISIVPAVANGTITPYTFADVTVPVAAAAKNVVVGVQTDTKDVATVGDAVTLATGKVTNAGTGDAVMVGLGTATTGTAVTTATLGTGSTGDVYAGETVTVGETSANVKVTGVAAAQTWTQDSGTIDGGAAAQTWTMDTGAVSVSGLVTVGGNVSVSGTTGNPIAKIQ